MNAEFYRKEVKLDHPDVPTRTTFPSIPRSQSNQYIKFTHSDMDRDAAQTTVPFFDAQKVRLPKENFKFNLKKLKCFR